MQNSESLKQQYLNQLIEQQQQEVVVVVVGGGTVPGDKSQPTESRRQGTMMTGPTHGKRQHPIIPSQHAGFGDG